MSASLVARRAALAQHAPADVVARVIWAEDRGGGRPGMEAVASVIMNRARNPRWWGSDPISVCLKPWQFSCLNENDPQLPRLLALTAGSDPLFLLALQIAENAIAGTLVDPTKNADSYYATSIAAPYWTQRAAFTVTIGGNRFYRLELSGPGGTMPPVPRPSIPEEDVADDLNAAELKTLNS